MLTRTDCENSVAWRESRPAGEALPEDRAERTWVREHGPEGKTKHGGMDLAPGHAV